MELDLDVAWLVGCAGLVFMMQPGFMCLESGLTRSKNSINVAVKNLTDFAISVMVFWLFGYGLLFGTSLGGWIGGAGFVPELSDSARLAAFFLFEAMFCGTATTIVSGAISERMRYSVYLVICLIISGLIYPLFGHWAWNGIEAGIAGGWLRSLGFLDFAGSTVVHSIGGWVSLAALLVIGPRIGRYSEGRVNELNRSSLPLSVLGTMLLWLGWMGFNGGSTLAFNDQIPRVIVQTILAGSSGLLSAVALGWSRRKLPQVEVMINGSLGGLVSITAGCNAVSTPHAALIGAIGGVVMLLATDLMNRCRIDDGVDAVAIHGFCGVWGTLAVALFGDLEILGTGLSRHQQVAVQLFGSGVAFVWAFGMSYLLLWGLNRLTPLRVSAEEEELGLNVSEHGAKTELYDLFRVMDDQAQTGNFSLRVPEVPYTEVGKIAYRYNQVMATVESYAKRLQRFNNRLERKVAERTSELAQANAELTRLHTVKDQFLANTSHELRTPLHGIIGLAESMLDGSTGLLSVAQQQNLSLIAQSGRRLAHLVNDILDFSQLKRDRLQIHPGSVDLHTVVDLILTMTEATIGKKNVALRNQVPPGLPPVWADANRLQQILYNLVGNGIKFTNSGAVTVSAQRRADRIEVAIADTGIGIPADQHSRIFESFEQGDGTTARRYGGTGLGLAVTQQLVLLHGGELTVESTVGVGSTFRFSLSISQGVPEPILPSALAPAPPLSSAFANALDYPDALEILAEAELAAVQQNGRRFKILVVDDEPVNLQVLVNQLSLENYEIIQAMSGFEALEIIEQGLQPDLILLDVMMPRMTGYEVCHRLRERFPANELPILMLTAKSQLADIVEGFQEGANDYLNKPIQKQELLARMRTHLYLSNLNIACSRFVPRQFLQILNKESILDVTVGDQIRQEMSILFSDIRDFTTLSEQMTPEDNFRFINGYLSRMEPAIVENQGFIDKYIGDAIMALFEEGADDAVRAAIAMLQTLEAYNRDRQALNRTPLRIGIGINTGDLMLGTVGGQSRIDGTVIGDVVNLASRMEGLTKRYRVPLLISESTFTRLQDVSDYAVRKIDRVQVKGKSEWVSVYEVFEADAPQLRMKKLRSQVKFEAAIATFHEGSYGQAQAQFSQYLVENSADSVAQVYLERCEQAIAVL